MLDQIGFGEEEHPGTSDELHTLYLLEHSMYSHCASLRVTKRLM
jgi:hypothetical protein